MTGPNVTLRGASLNRERTSCTRTDFSSRPLRGNPSDLREKNVLGGNRSPRRADSAYCKETVLRIGRRRHTATALELPQQLALGLEKLFIVEETFTVQLSQVAQTRGHIHSRHG